MTVSVKGQVSDSLKTRFGIREITSDQNTIIPSVLCQWHEDLCIQNELDTGAECCGIR